MLRLAFHLILAILAIKGTISQESCCQEKTINHVKYILTQDEVEPSPSCVNGCIYQEADNPSSYACFIEAFNEVECSVEVEQQESSFTSSTTSTTSETTTVCQDGWDYFPYTNQCYKHFNYSTSITWMEAQLTCRQFGGNLPIIRDEETNLYVSNLVGGALNWIGGYRVGPENA